MSALDQMRETVREKAAQGPKPRKKVWAPPDPTRFRNGLVLSFDQTLTNTGVALVESSHDGITVRYAKTERVKSNATSFEGTYDKADKMGILIAATVAGLAIYSPEVVNEMPAVQGHRIESSFLAGYLVRKAVEQYGRGLTLTVISKQAAGALLCPPEERHEKRYVKQAIEALIPKERRTGEHIHNWNEHVHDAVANALFHLYVKEA